MKKLLLLTAIAATASIIVHAQNKEQTSDGPIAPLVAPTANGVANFCTVSYSAYTEDQLNHAVARTLVTVNANAWKDVQDDHERQVKILRVLAKEQNKGGPYTITVSETMNCDDKTENARIPSGSIYVEGVTLEGTTKVGDMLLAMGKEINDRYKKRAAAGAKTGWDHAKAKKTRRNDMGQVIFEEEGPK